MRSNTPPITALLKRCGLGDARILEILIGGMCACTLVLGFCAGYLFAKF